jgi:hypothetical protein
MGITREKIKQSNIDYLELSGGMDCDRLEDIPLLKKLPNLKNMPNTKKWLEDHAGVLP